MKEMITKRIERTKVIAVADGIYGEACLMLAKALRNGGVELLELVLHEDNHQLVWSTIQKLRRVLISSMTIGIGNCLSIHEVNTAKDCGAGFVSSYFTDKDVIHAANELDLVMIPGALTPTEIVYAHRVGADFVKVFPAGSMGPAYFKDIRPAIKDIPILAHGGITRPNVRLYEHAGAVGIFADDCLFTQELVTNEDWLQITNTTKTFISTL